MYDKAFLELAHKSCSSHKEELEKSKLCGCFYCLETFEPKEIIEYFEENLDSGETAICPKCGIDSVLSDKFPISDKSFLEAMQIYYFNK
jgi:hypothetical protein